MAALQTIAKVGFLPDKQNVKYLISKTGLHNTYNDMTESCIKCIESGGVYRFGQQSTVRNLGLTNGNDSLKRMNADLQAALHGSATDTPRQ
jgi:hypothetical protein